MKLQWLMVGLVAALLAAQPQQPSGQTGRQKKGAPPKEQKAKPPAEATGKETSSAPKGGPGDLQGTWAVTALSAEGQQIPPQNFRHMQVEIKGTDITLSGEHATLKIDANAKPHQVDMTYTGGDKKGQVAHGIYSLQGNTLLLAIGTTGGRPSSFGGGPGQMVYQLVRTH